MRNLLSGWARRHTEGLRALKHADANDRRALDAVVSALPSFPTVDSVGFDARALLAGPVTFNWNAYGKTLGSEPPLSPDPKVRRARQLGRVAFQQQVARDFKAFRDVQVSESMVPGRVKYTIWASGRITVTTLTPTMLRDGSAIELESHLEIVPPYEFLRESKREEVSGK